MKEIVIKIHDIPQNDHERWALKNGTPLPKGHGRLIDADAFKKYIIKGFEEMKSQFKTEFYLDIAARVTESFLEDIDEQPTVESQPNRCDSCTHSEEQDGSNCYECVKGMTDNFEAQPSEDTEVIKISKGAVKTRQGRYVIYDVEWLKENFYTTEEKIYGQPKQPCEDCISKEAVDALIDELARAISDERCFISRGRSTAAIMQDILDLPPVTPQPCEDAVSRQDVDAYIAKLMSGYLYDEERTRLEEFSAYLWELPPVTPRTNLAETSQDCISILNRIMEYTYGMLTAEKYGLQHLIKSMMDELSGGEEGE